MILALDIKPAGLDLVPTEQPQEAVTQNINIYQSQSSLLEPCYQEHKRLGM